MIVRHLLFRFSRAYRAQCIMQRVLEHRSGVRLVVIPSRTAREWRLAA